VGAIGLSRGLLRSASNDPEDGIPLDGYGREPGQRGDLLRDVRGHVVIDRLFSQEKNDFARFFAAACCAIDCCWGNEIGGLGTRDAMTYTGEAI